MAMPVIYKGDDTDFRGSTGFTLKVVTSSNLNLSGCTVEVEVLGFRKSFPASATGELVCPFAFTAAETQRMPLGIHAATVRVYDSKGRVRTINNSIRVKVTNSVHEAYGVDDPQEVTLAVSTVDLEPYAKKDEVTAAIAKAMKDASASTQLNALAPETGDTTVTLKPEDGKANYVVEKVGVGKSEIMALCDFDVGLIVYVYDRTTSSTVMPESIRLQIPKAEYVSQNDVYVNYRVASSMNFAFDTEFGTIQVAIPQGFIITFPDELGTFDPYANADRISVPADMVYFGASPTFELTSDNENLYVSEYGIQGDPVTVHHYTEVVSRFKTPVVVIPDINLDTDNEGKTRRFSLTLETDAEEEMDVTWDGGTVIEKFAGASRLAVGRTVWGVKEISPNVFLVDRTPGASGVALTGDNGNVYSLVAATIADGTVALQDRAVNAIRLGSDVTECTFVFPERIEGKARDFMLRLELVGEEMPPTLSFTEPDGSHVNFDYTDEDWAAVELGVNVFMFSDTKEAE